jgi:hypothetical protein
MRPNFTLPELQTRLDRLDQGAMQGIPIRTLNGCSQKSDVAAARLFHFAKGHDCIISRDEGAPVRMAL